MSEQVTELTGTSKGIERVGLGSWFVVYDEDEDVSKWVCCHAVLRGTLNATGQKITELRGMTAAGELIAFTDLDNSPIVAVTKREATRAGWTDPRLDEDGADQ